ncbi:MAG TPA: TonB family protein [Candidatus Omnitrophota bacterium]|nr:TonB family protein [Candidatus Omnitrophota bacterium]
MTRSKELTNMIVFALVMLAAFTLYMSSRPKPAASTQTFVYQEVRAQKAATRVAVQAETAPIALPEKPASVTVPVIPPRVISEVLPEYPASALEKGTEGVVLVQAYIGASGKPEKVEVKTSSGNAELDSAAVSAVSQWIFSPASQSSAAVASWFEVPVRFNLK